MTGVILAAGNGVRLKASAGKDCCKVLMRLGGKCLIEYALENLYESGVEKIFVVVGQYEDLITAQIGCSYRGIKIQYIKQKKQQGLINAFVQALKKASIEDDVILQLADEIFINCKIDSVKNICMNMVSDFYCGITYESISEKIKNNFSVAINDNLEIKRCIEKPHILINNIKGTGFCIFKKDVVQILTDIYNEESNDPKELCDFFNYLILNGKTGTAFEIADIECNINTLDDLAEASAFL